MNAYVGHSNSFDFQADLYHPLKTISGHIFYFPHEQGSKIQFNSKELFQSKKCDLFLAEVSYPSTGLGIEVGWANNAEIPIVCIFKTGSKISNSLKMVCQKFIEYQDSQDLIQKLERDLRDRVNHVVAKKHGNSKN